ncbi:MAG: DUF4124 domain-containing protein, partial [Telluria sp.]|nr:DUF4124 domain-containing protein [Telluria sp.]
MKTFNWKGLTAAAALMLWAGLSQAQYMWIDEKGFKQLSDRPPPPTTPVNKILKSPTPVKPAFEIVPDASPNGGASAAAPAVSGPPLPKPPPTLAERDADFRKRAAEQADKAAKAQEDERIKAGNAANCAAARQ